VLALPGLTSRQWRKALPMEIAVRRFAASIGPNSTADPPPDERAIPLEPAWLLALPIEVISGPVSANRDDRCQVENFRSGSCLCTNSVIHRFCNAPQVQRPDRRAIRL